MASEPDYLYTIRKYAMHLKLFFTNNFATLLSFRLCIGDI